MVIGCTGEDRTSRRASILSLARVGPRCLLAGKVLGCSFGFTPCTRWATLSAAPCSAVSCALLRSQPAGKVSGRDSILRLARDGPRCQLRPAPLSADREGIMARFGFTPCTRWATLSAAPCSAVSWPGIMLRSDSPSPGLEIQYPNSRASRRRRAGWHSCRRQT